jgi:hypothetical protein
MKWQSTNRFSWDSFVIGLVVLCFGDNRWLLWIGIAIGGIIYINWEFLVSIGLGLVIVIVAPCLAMCVWHLAMNTKPADDNECGE